MFKALFLAAALSLSSIAAMAAIPSSLQQQKNFNTCKDSDESWMRRWGQYVVAFEYKEAANTCHRWAWPEHATYRQAGCYIDRSFLKAGYYCQKIGRGN